MSLGSIVRRVAGPLERPMGRAYRAAFINVTQTMRCIAPHIPAGAHLIDVGGGDGDMLNVLMRLRSDVRVTMIDRNPSIGRFLDADLRERVTLHPNTGLADYSGQPADAVLVSDVVHHVPVDMRASFLEQAKQLVRPGGVLIVKDVAPGRFLSWLNCMADRYISGDRDMQLMEVADLKAGVGVPSVSVLPEHHAPNYALAFVMPKRADSPEGCPA